MSAGPTRAVVLLAALSSGLAVASVYFAQPLLDAIGHDLDIAPAALGAVGAVTQGGYGLGLLALVPLGDLLDRRWLIIGQTVLSAVALAGVALAVHGAALLGAVFLVGLLAVVAQLHVAHMAAQAGPGRRGQVVGTVTTGIVTGILLARVAAGVAADLFGWRAIFAIAAAAQVLVALALAAALPRQARRAAPGSYFALVASVFTLFAQEPVLRARGVLALLVFMAVTVLWTSLALALRAAPHHLSHSAVGLFGLAGVLGAAGAALAGRRADAGKAQHTTGAALALMLAAWLPLAAVPHSLVAGVVGVVGIDFGLQAVHVSSQSLVYRVRPEAQSRLTAGYMLFYSAGCALGAVLSTQAFVHAGWPGVSVLGFATSLAALLQWRATRGAGEGGPEAAPAELPMV